MACAQTAQPNTHEALYQQAVQWLSEGRLTEARDALLKLLALQPDHAGAWLDLALLHCQMGQGNEADALFTMVTKQFAPPPALGELIESLRQQGCHRKTAAHHFRMQYGLGTDSNVNQGASNPSFTLDSGTNATPLMLASEYTPKPDQFKTGTLEWSWTQNADGAQAYAQLQARQHNHYPQYDLTALVLGLERPWQVGAWNWRGSASLSMTTPGGALYQRQAQLKLQALAPAAVLGPVTWQFPVGWVVGGSGTWAGSAYPTLNGFDAQFWEIRAVVAYEAQGRSVHASLGYALDNGQVQRPGNDRSGAVLGLMARIPLENQVLAEMGVGVQSWKSQNVYAPGLIDTRRDQLSTLLRLGVTVPTALNQALRLELRHVRNDENVTLFTYHGTQLQLSWEWHLTR